MDRARRTMTALVALLMLVGAGWLPNYAAESQESDHAVIPTGSLASNHQFSTDTLADAERAEARGDFHAADALYRAALNNERTKPEATKALWELHDREDFELPADESEVARALEDAQGPLDRYETAHFILLSNAESDWVRARGRLMEDARRQYIREMNALGVHIVPHPTKLIVILWSDKPQFREYAINADGLDAEWVAGYFSIADNRAVFYDARSNVRPATTTTAAAHDQSNGVQVHHAPQHQSHAATTLALQAADDVNCAKTIHETIHLLAFNTGLQERGKIYPIWLSEGIAVTFEPGSGRAFGPSRDTPVRGAIFDRLREDDNLMDWRELVGRLRVPNDPDGVEQTYAQSYALFTFCYRHKSTQLADYIDRINTNGLPRTRAGRQTLFESCFGPLDKIALQVERM